MCVFEPNEGASQIEKYVTATTTQMKVSVTESSSYSFLIDDDGQLGLGFKGSFWKYIHLRKNSKGRFYIADRDLKNVNEFQFRYTVADVVTCKKDYSKYDKSELILDNNVKLNADKKNVAAMQKQLDQVEMGIKAEQKKLSNVGKGLSFNFKHEILDNDKNRIKNTLPFVYFFDTKTMDEFITRRYLYGAEHKIEEVDATISAKVKIVNEEPQMIVIINGKKHIFEMTREYNTLRFVNKAGEKTSTIEVQLEPTESHPNGITASIDVGTIKVRERPVRLTKEERHEQEREQIRLNLSKLVVKKQELMTSIEQFHQPRE